jgi:small GTP-binding protein
MSSFKIKILLTGAAAVGKRSLVQRFIKNRFAANYKLTVGVDILTKDVEFRQGEIATLSIWDIGGQQRFEFIRSTFYKGVSRGVMLVFDLTREQTYTETRKWLTEIRQFAGENIPFVLIGNKADLIEDVGVVIERKEAKSFAEKEGSIYIETSAKTGENVDEALIALTRRIIDARNPT